MLDFKVYLDMVNEAGRRTRNLIYVWMAVLAVCILTLSHVLLFTWMDHRWEALRDAHALVIGQFDALYPDVSVNEKNLRVRAAMEYAERMGLPAIAPKASVRASSALEDVKAAVGKLDKKSEHYEYVKSVYADSAKGLAQKRLDSRTFSMPVFGISTDVNNLSWVFALTCLVLSWLLRSSLEHEISAISMALRKLKTQYNDAESQSDSANALESIFPSFVMLAQSQVMSSRRRYNHGHRWVMWLYLWIPAPLGFMFVFHDIDELHNFPLNFSAGSMRLSLTLAFGVWLLWKLWVNSSLLLRLTYAFGKPDHVDPWLRFLFHLWIRKPRATSTHLFTLDEPEEETQNWLAALKTKSREYWNETEDRVSTPRRQQP